MRGVRDVLALFARLSNDLNPSFVFEMTKKNWARHRMETRVFVSCQKLKMGAAYKLFSAKVINFFVCLCAYLLVSSLHRQLQSCCTQQEILPVQCETQMDLTAILCSY